MSHGDGLALALSLLGVEAERSLGDDGSGLAARVDPLSPIGSDRIASLPKGSPRLDMWISEHPLASGALHYPPDEG